MKTSTKKLVERWSVSCKQARYSEWGNWYASVSTYPVALLDSEGFIIFDSADELKNTTGVKVTKQINVPIGISKLSGYVRAVSQIPEEIGSKEIFTEGSVTRISINRFERNAKARKACLEHHGYKCSVCDWSGLDFFGTEGEGIIHVHHLTEISSIGEEYNLNPIDDLIPVCPNCHAFIHSFRPPLTIEEAKGKIMRPNKSVKRT